GPGRFGDQQLRVLQDVDDEIPAPPVGADHLADAVLWTGQRGFRRDLRDRRDARRVRLEDFGRGVDEIDRPRDVTETPSGHRVRFGEGECGHDAVVVRRELGGTRPRYVADDLIIAFVD